VTGTGGGVVDTKKRGRSELGIRFVLGPLMLALIAGIYWLDSTVMFEGGHRGYLSAGVLGLLAFGGALEYVAMFRRADFAVATRLLPGTTLALCIAPFVIGGNAAGREFDPLVLFTIALLFAVAFESLSKRKMAIGLEQMGGTLLGFLLIAWPLFLGQVLAIQHLPSLLFVVLVCKGGDIGAYLFGVALGRHRLIPHISGGKTIEGSLGGVVTAVGLALLLRPFLLAPEVSLGLTATVLAGIILNVTTQTGDLIESLLKRRCGVKDSSHLLPAHGGILDLVDSLLFSFPVWFLILAYGT
jgi:CDP-diglyceride synthetase